MKTRLFVSLDVGSAAEAVATSRALGDSGVGVRVGPRLLSALGPMVVAALRSDVEVLVDARVSGDARESCAAVRALLGVGSHLVTVDHRVGSDALGEMVGAAGARGAYIVAITEPPGGAEPASGRGRAVSGAARIVAAAGVHMVLGETRDVGVVAQVAPELDVIVHGCTRPEEVSDALSRGAAGVVVDGGVIRGTDPKMAVAPFIDAFRNTIEPGGQ